MNKNEISLQVYTARNFKPYEDIFKFLSDSGLENVELFEVEAFDETKELLEKYSIELESYNLTKSDSQTNVQTVDEKIEEDDDVQQVFHNRELTEEILKEMEE